MLQASMVGEQQKPFGISIEAPSGVNIGVRQIGFQRAPAFPIRKLGKHPVGLMKA